MSVLLRFARFGGKRHAGLNIFGCYARIFLHYFLKCGALSQKPHDIFNCQARSFDDGLANHYVRIDDDTL